MKRQTDPCSETFVTSKAECYVTSNAQLIIDGKSIYLTPKEFEVLQYLIKHIGKVLTPDAILMHVWGTERLGDPDLVKQYIYRLRQKVERDPENPKYLHTVWGEGYYFDSEEVA